MTDLIRLFANVAMSYGRSSRSTLRSRSTNSYVGSSNVAKPLLRHRRLFDRSRRNASRLSDVDQFRSNSRSTDRLRPPP